MIIIMIEFIKYSSFKVILAGNCVENYFESYCWCWCCYDDEAEEHNSNSGGRVGGWLLSWQLRLRIKVQIVLKLFRWSGGSVAMFRPIVSVRTKSAKLIWIAEWKRLIYFDIAAVATLLAVLLLLLSSPVRCVPQLPSLNVSWLDCLSSSSLVCLSFSLIGKRADAIIISTSARIRHAAVKSA